MAVGAVVYRTADGRRQREFYTDAFGFEAVDTDAGFELRSDDETLAAFVEDPDAPRRPLDAAGLFHTAFLVEDRQELADAVSRLQDRGYSLTGVADHLVSEAVYLDDPDGNGVELYRDRPRSEWTRTEDGDVEIDTMPLEVGGLVEEGDAERGFSATVGHVHLEVTDLDSSEEFYRGLEFELQARMPKARFLGRSGYHHHVGVNTWGNASEPLRDDAIGLAGFEVEDVDGVQLDPDGVRVAEDYHALL